jgi:hypothetical protein
MRVGDPQCKNPRITEPRDRNQPARQEIDKFAHDTFDVVRGSILLKYGDPGKYASNETARTGNLGAYLPALIDWGSQRVRDSILALADSFVEAFSLFQRPSDRPAETELERSAKEMTAGTISAVRAQLSLHSLRTSQTIDSGTPFHLEIERAMRAATKEAFVRLRRQRIEYRERVQIPEARVFELAEELGKDADGLTFDEFYQVLEVYRKRFPQFGHTGVKGQRWAAMKRAQFATWKAENAEYRAQISANRDVILAAWRDAENRVANPEIWRNYRNEFQLLSVDEQKMSLAGASHERFWTGGDFAGGFKAIAGNTRIARHFEEIATRAGLDLICPKGIEPSSFWQACVFVYLQQSGAKEIFLSGSSGDEGGCLLKPIEASEEVCSYLSKKAFGVLNAILPAQPAWHGAPTVAISSSGPETRDQVGNRANSSRWPSSITSPEAVRRIVKYLKEHPELSLSEFARAAQIEERTLRRIRSTGRTKRSIFLAIATAMQIDLAALLKPD